MNIKYLKLIFFSFIFLQINCSNNKIVKVPKEIGADEVLNIDTLEIFSQETFLSLIQKYIKQNKKFLLARVVTEKKSQYYINYYDAFSLNKHLFEGYPITDDREKRLSLAFFKQQNKKFHINPLNNVLIHSIQYFSLENMKENEFKYICSSQSLLTSLFEKEREGNLKIFYENHIDMDSIKKIAEHYLIKSQDLFKIYEEKRDPKHLAIAMEYLAFAQKLDVDLFGQFY